MQMAGLIGDPVAHSLSPVMHNAAFAALGIDATYELWPTPLAELADRVASLRGGNVLGANVTVPHKEAVVPLVDEVSPTASRIGAVNTVIPRDGLLVGDNTDAYGFAKSLEEELGGRTIGRAVMVGAGGASRAVLVALQEAGALGMLLANRTVGKAEALARELGSDGLPAIEPIGLDLLPAAAGGAHVLVNATAVGWHGDELPFGEGVLDLLSPEAIVVDLTYRSTALLRAASARGLRVLDGLPMLVHQGARSFELWTGQAAPLEVMFQAVRAEHARRG
jgi:shikimate dehydrogenase